MAQPPTADPKLAKLLREVEIVERKIERAQALSQRLKRLAVDHSRRADTRRKIILGGALLNAARSEPELAALVARFVAAITRPADLKPFEGFSTEELIAAAMDQNASAPRRPRRLTHKPD
ncbi:hypothetical protein [Sphingomonas sp. CFBP9019]|jgi:hypothetical protein|uniref:hypothetical protein n=1 Tax=Sphingomonas sp. CFBP9019 TaxID=3096532 RepID=UPI002A69DE4A|nr:hypothetical protein [Sphingomonas sp. CFBP9019]MDY1010344.1 hypothetical protein [Sphingomonas sp. CFBP9019]